jgi:hypothetical protein
VVRRVRGTGEGGVTISCLSMVVGCGFSRGDSPMCEPCHAQNRPSSHDENNIEIGKPHFVCVNNNELIL